MRIEPIQGEFVPEAPPPKVQDTAVAAPLPDRFQVEATALGYFLWLRRPGDVFVVPKALFSPTWMKLVPETATIVSEKQVTDESASDAPGLLRSSAP